MRKLKGNFDFYESPALNVITLKTENCLCASVDFTTQENGATNEGFDPVTEENYW